MTTKGGRIGKNQPTHHCAAQNTLPWIVGQQAGIDCNAAMKAVKVPKPSWLAEVEPG
ncbi:MAG: hypothetical protein HGA71_07825 [Azonexaceae bacterium]|nr:hypothetical protein [Azonexaceae bacterium]